MLDDLGISFFDYLNEIESMYLADFEKEFVKEKISQLSKEYGSAKTSLSLNVIRQNELFIFQQSNIELIFFELLKYHKKSIRVVVELSKYEIEYLKGFLTDMSVEDIIEMLTFGNKLQYSRLIDWANGEHWPQMNLVLDLELKDISKFFKIVNLFFLMGGNLSFGFYENHNKIAVIDHSYTLIVNSKYIKIEDILEGIKKKVPKFPLGLFEDE